MNRSNNRHYSRPQPPPAVRRTNSSRQSDFSFELKTCQLCYNDLPTTLFLPDKRTSDGFRNYCQKCEDNQKKKSIKKKSILDDTITSQKSKMYHMKRMYSAYDDEDNIHGNETEEKNMDDSEFDVDTDHNVKSNYPNYYVSERFKVGVHRNIICYGESGCGKTKMLLEGIWPELNNYYDMIILVSKSLDTELYEKNLTFIDRKLAFDDNLGPILEDIILYNSKSKIPLHIMIVLDDMTTENLGQCKALNTLFCRGRNLNISTLIMLHNLTSMSATARKNIHELWVKAARSDESVDDLRDKFISERIINIPKTMPMIEGSKARRGGIIRIEDKHVMINKWIDGNLDKPRYSGFVIQFPNHYTEDKKIFKLPNLEMLKSRNKGNTVQHPTHISDDDEDDIDNDDELMSDYEDFSD